MDAHQPESGIVAVTPAAPTSTRLVVAPGEATDRLQLLQHHAICTMPAPWALVSAAAAAPEHLIMAGAVERADLEALAAAVPAHVTAIVGVGAGTCVDTAKFLAVALRRDLLQIPTAVSSDAPFTSSYRLREHGHVRRGGDIRPVDVVIDPLVILQAPPGLNRAGVGDVLACHTALYDWRLAARTGAGAGWDAEVAAAGLRLLDQLEFALADIAAVSVEGIVQLARAHRTLAELRERGGLRVVEGSEHALAAVIEWLTGRRFIHGRLVAMCTVAIAQVQGNDPDRVARIVAGSLIDAAPEGLGIDRELFRRAIAELPGYCRRERLPAGVVDLVELTPALADEMFDRVCEVAG